MQKPMLIVILTSASLKQSLEALVAWLMLLCLAVMKAQTIHGQWHHHQSYHHHRHQSLSSKRAESKTHKWLCQCHLSISIGSLWAVQVGIKLFSLSLSRSLFIRVKLSSISTNISNKAPLPGKTRRVCGDWWHLQEDRGGQKNVWRHLLIYFYKYHL